MTAVGAHGGGPAVWPGAPGSRPGGDVLVEGRCGVRPCEAVRPLGRGGAADVQVGGCGAGGDAARRQTSPDTPKRPAPAKASKTTPTSTPSLEPKAAYYAPCTPRSRSKTTRSPTCVASPTPRAATSGYTPASCPSTNHRCPKFPPERPLAVSPGTTGNNPASVPLDPPGSNREPPRYLPVSRTPTGTPPGR